MLASLHLREQGETANDEDIAHLSPLCHGHINILLHAGRAGYERASTAIKRGVEGRKHYLTVRAGRKTKDTACLPSVPAITSWPAIACCRARHRVTRPQAGSNMTPRNLVGAPALMSGTGHAQEVSGVVRRTYEGVMKLGQRVRYERQGFR